MMKQEGPILRPLFYAKNFLDRSSSSITRSKSSLSIFGMLHNLAASKLWRKIPSEYSSGRNIQSSVVGKRCCSSPYTVLCEVSKDFSLISGAKITTSLQCSEDIAEWYSCVMLLRISMNLGWHVCTQLEEHFPWGITQLLYRLTEKQVIEQREYTLGFHLGSKQLLDVTSPLAYSQFQNGDFFFFFFLL